MRPLSRAALLALQKYYDVDLTYTSNAVEGSTLTLRETAEVIEHGIAVGGKPLRDHLEAVDHYNAVLWIRELAAGDCTFGEATVRELHRRIVASQPARDRWNLQHSAASHCRLSRHFSERCEDPRPDAGLRRMARQC